MFAFRTKRWLRNDKSRNMQFQKIKILFADLNANDFLKNGFINELINIETVSVELGPILSKGS